MSYRYIIAFSIIIGLCVILDTYTLLGLRKRSSKKFFRFLKWFVPLSTVFFFFGFILNIYRAGQGIYNASYILNIITGFTFGVFIAKLVIAGPLLIEDTVRIIRYLFLKIRAQKGDEVRFPSRRRFVRNISLGMAAVPLSGAVYAITRGKYNFQVKELTLEFEELPPAFDGFKIAHFSDFHAGSFDDDHQVKRGLKLINEGAPDVLFFTGDLVNNRPQEAEPYVGFLSELSAPFGKFSIAGNHDYGDYIPFSSEEERKENWSYFEDIHARSGFQLLKNERVYFQKGEDELALLGVENWGNAPFPQYGDLDAVTKGLKNEVFSILLSHDPDHWEYVTRHYHKKIHLTLSGHTHGAQFGVEIPGWKWSPVKYRYKRWLGLYADKGRYLFVSKGFGFLGFPGRFGMSPEVVFITLKSAQTKNVIKT
jgi:uncharacterized protein